MVEARQEPVRPDRAVGQVAEDAVAFAAAERLLGRRQRERAEVLDPGQRVAGVGEVAQVPVATPRERRQSRRAGAPASVAPRGASTTSRATSTAAGSRKLSLVPAARPAASPTRSRAPRRERPALPACPAAAPRHAFSATATAASRKKMPTMSLRASPAWSASAGTLERQGAQRQRARRHPVRPPNAPGGDQAADEPAEVEQRREQVPVKGEHPRRVEDFRVRRVEPGEELRRDEVQVPGVAALEEARRERAVVPGACRSRSSR